MKKSSNVVWDSVLYLNRGFFIGKVGRFLGQRNVFWYTRYYEGIIILYTPVFTECGPDKSGVGWISNAPADMTRQTEPTKSRFPETIRLKYTLEITIFPQYEGSSPLNSCSNASCFMICASCFMISDSCFVIVLCILCVFRFYFVICASCFVLHVLRFVLCFCASYFAPLAFRFMLLALGFALGRHLSLSQSLLFIYKSIGK